jgi:branched-chain amino acid transport system substrate-binding protein
LKRGEEVKNRIVSISLALVLALSVGLAGCGGEQVPEYNLTISTTQGGEVTSPGEGTFTYDQGTVVPLVVFPHTGYRFVNWTGDVDTIDDTSAASTTITMQGNYEITANFEETPPDSEPEAPTIKIAVVGPFTDVVGQDHWDGACMAADEINFAGGLTINGTHYAVELVKVETKESTEGEDGSTGTANLNAVIDDVVFCVGGFQPEVLQVYREVAMTAKKIFMNCGVGTDSLQFSVVTDYDRYKYWFKPTPLNSTFLVRSLIRMTLMIANILKGNLQAYEALDLVKDDYKVSTAVDQKLRVYILMENTARWDEYWPYLNDYLPVYGLNVVGGVRVSPTATDISSELTAAKTLNPHIIYTGFFGSVGDVYSLQKVTLGIPAMTIGTNVAGAQLNHWANTDGACEGEILVDTWAVGTNNTNYTYDWLNDYITRTGRYPVWTAGTYDAVRQVCRAIDATDSLDSDDLVAWLENPANAMTDSVSTPKVMYYPMPEIDLGGGIYALSEPQVRALYPNLATYNQINWLCAASGGPHIAHDIVYGPGYVTGIGSQWQDGHKVGVWPMDLGDASDVVLTNQYGCWNFEYPGTVDLVIPIEGFLTS